MYSWTVRCVGLDDDAAHDDCRAITTLGVEVAHNLREKDADLVASNLLNDNAAYHLEVDGERVPLQGASDGSHMYVRTRDEDTSDDPLLDLPTIEEYRRAERFQPA